MENKTSDALQQPPSFDDMVGLIKKLFTDYLTDIQKNAFTAEEIEKAWERYKTLNHLWQDNAQPAPRWVKASERLPMHKAFWLIEEGFKKDCSFPVRVDGKNYGMGEVFSDAEDGKSKFYFVIKGHSKDYYEDEFHRIEWLDEQPAAEPLTENARYELRLALRDMIKLVKRIYGDSAIPAEHQKRLDAADGLLQKHSKITDVLRTPAAGREEDACDFAEWMRLNCVSSQHGWVDALGKWDTTKGWYELFKQQHNP